MDIDIADNPNCTGSQQFVFNELEEPRSIRGIRVSERGVESVCGVTGVAKGGGWVAAHAVKVTDSGAGYAFLIFGGEWGIRLRPETFALEPWDLEDHHQWGEPFKLYGESEDLVYAD